MINRFISNAFKLSQKKFGTKTLTILGQSIDITSDSSTHYSEGVLGGIEADNRITISVLTSLLPVGITDLNGVIVQVQGQDWRVEKINLGDAITSINLIDPDFTD